MRLAAVMAFYFVIRIFFPNHVCIFFRVGIGHAIPVEEGDLFKIFCSDLVEQLHHPFLDRIRSDHQIPVMDPDHLTFGDIHPVQFYGPGSFRQFTGFDLEQGVIHRLDDQMARVSDLIVRLQRTAERQILLRLHRVEMLEQRLKACNPERIYQMGYSLLTKNGRVVRSVHELQSGDVVITHLSDGAKEAVIKA